MAADYLFRPSAEQELDEAYNWSENNRQGRGKKLLAHVTKSVKSICGSPLIGRVITTRIRRVVVPKFPYAIYYSYESAENLVVIHCVFHTSQDPAKLKDRLPEQE